MAIFPFQAQYDSMDCGPTCVYMICRAYGKHISLQHIREKAQIGKDGVNLLGISEAAESLGFRTIAAKVSIEQLANDVQLPAILHWNQNHFVVLTDVKQPGFWRKLFSKRKKGVQGKNYKFIVADPAKSIITYTEEELTKNWISDVKDGRKTGTLLMLDPTASFYEQAEAEPSKGLGFSLLYGYLKKHYKLVVNLILSLAIGSILQLILPFLTQSIVDTGVNSQDLNFVYLVLLGQLALFAGRLIVEFVRGWILLHISTRINVGIITDFLIKLMRLPISFFDTKQTGDLLQRINDHYRIESFLTGTSLNVLFSMFNIIVFSIVLAVFNVGIFLAFMLASVLYATWVIFFLKFRRKLDYQHFEMQAKEQGTTIQLIQSMQEIKLHGCEKNKRWEWERIQANLMKISMKSLALNQYQQAGAFFINEGKNILITFLSASAVINGSLTIGSMLAIQYIIGQLNSPVEQMIEFVRNFQNAKISIERLNEIHTLDDEEPSSMNLIYQLPPDVQSMIAGGKANSQSKSNRPLPQSIDTQEQREAFSDKRLDFAMNGGYENAEAITIKDLTFTYKGAGNTPVLKSLDLQIPLGKTTAIVGTSGSGKTTLLKLLLKFYDPQKGEIRIGNTNLATISHRTWRSYCGVVMQESYIFSDTIARNIAVGEERVDMAQLYYAAAVANIKEFIENLPLGFNTKIGADGLGISQGQKQRLLIARAVYKNPDFIFFDEATNSLDANNESTILNNLWSIFKNKTVVVVAHRLSTVKNADQIVVVKNGEIIEKGTHQELIALKGDYYILVKNQLELGS